MHRIVEFFRQVVLSDRVRETRPSSSGHDNLSGGRVSRGIGVTNRQRTFLMGSAVVLGAILLLWEPAPVAPDQPTSSTEVVGSAPPVDPSPAPTSAAATPAAVGEEAELVPGPAVDRSEYALGMHELSGFPRQTPPGARMELWVAWDPPLTKAPDVRRLIKDVIVADIIPPLTPDGPTAVIVSVPTARVPDLIYGDRYGDLSVVLPGR